LAKAVGDQELHFDGMASRLTCVYVDIVW